MKTFQFIVLALLLFILACTTLSCKIAEKQRVIILYQKEIIVHQEEIIRNYTNLIESLPDDVYEDIIVETQEYENIISNTEKLNLYRY